MIKHGSSFRLVVGEHGFESFEVNRNAAESVGEGVVQLAGEAVAFAAGGKAFKSVGILTQLDVCQDQFVFLFLLLFVEMVYNEAYEREGKRPHNRQGKKGKGFEMKLSEDKVGNNEIGEIGNQGVDKDDMKIVLPGDKDYRNDQDRNQGI